MRTICRPYLVGILFSLLLPAGMIVAQSQEIRDNEIDPQYIENYNKCRSPYGSGFGSAPGTSFYWQEGKSTTSSTLMPDAIFFEPWPGKNCPARLDEQVKMGKGVFIEGLMPLDFVFTLRAAGNPITLYGGKDTKPFTDYIHTTLWVGGGLPINNEMECEVIAVHIPARYTFNWERDLREGNPVVLKDEEVAGRVRLKFNEEKLSRRLKEKNLRKYDQYIYGVSINIELGKVKGNEKLAEYLNRPGNVPVIGFPSIHFSLAPKEQLQTDEYLLFHYHTWKLCSAHDKYEPSLEAYKAMIEIKPNHEPLLLNYAKFCEDNGKLDEAIRVVKELIELVGKEPRGDFQITHLDIFTLQQWALTMSFSPSELGPPKKPEELVQILEQHVKRLEEKTNHKK